MSFALNRSLSIEVTCFLILFDFSDQLWSQTSQYTLFGVRQSTCNRGSGRPLGCNFGVFDFREEDGVVVSAAEMLDFPKREDDICAINVVTLLHCSKTQDGDFRISA